MKSFRRPHKQLTQLWFLVQRYFQLSAHFIRSDWQLQPLWKVHVKSLNCLQKIQVGDYFLKFRDSNEVTDSSDIIRGEVVVFFMFDSCSAHLIFSGNTLILFALFTKFDIGGLVQIVPCVINSLECYHTGWMSDYVTLLIFFKFGSGHGGKIKGSVYIAIWISTRIF